MTSVSGSTIVVKDVQGFTRTIRLADGATVTKDGAKSSASAIAKGQHVEAGGTVAADGTTLTATTIGLGRPAAPDGGPMARHERHPGNADAPEGGVPPTPPTGSPSTGS